MERPVVGLGHPLGTGRQAREGNEDRVGGLLQLLAGQASRQPGGKRRECDRHPQHTEGADGRGEPSSEARDAERRTQDSRDHDEWLTRVLERDQGRQVEVSGDEAGKGTEGAASKRGPQRLGSFRRVFGAHGVFSEPSARSYTSLISSGCWSSEFS